LLAALAALVTGSALAGSAARYRVSLTASTGAIVQTDDAVVLTAKATPKLPKGARLLVEERGEDDATWQPAKECGASTCKVTWREPDSGAVAFRARAIRRKSGAKGRIVQVLATSKLVAISWQAPLPPPPPPPEPKVQPGHYCGFTDQGKSICFDVSSDSSSIANYKTESIVDCSPSSRWIWTIGFTDSAPIGPDLTFTYTFNGGLTSTDGKTSDITANYTLKGTFDTAGNASGTIALNSIAFDYQGTHYSCSSAPYAWKAKLGA
jgi:hypothetical protein